MTNLSKEQNITIKVKDGIMQINANGKAGKFKLDIKNRCCETVWIENIVAMSNSLVLKNG